MKNFWSQFVAILNHFRILAKDAPLHNTCRKAIFKSRNTLACENVTNLIKMYFSFAFQYLFSVHAIGIIFCMNSHQCLIQQQLAHLVLTKIEWCTTLNGKRGGNLLCIWLKKLWNLTMVSFAECTRRLLSTHLDFKHGWFNCPCYLLNIFAQTKKWRIVSKIS